MTEPGKASPESASLKDVAEAVGLVTAPAAGFAALGLYFGWKRTQTYAFYFGIDTSLLGFSVQDYVLRSARSIYTIILAVVLVGLAALLFHRATSAAAPPLARLAGIIMVSMGLWLLLTWAHSPLNRLLDRPSPSAQALVAVGGAMVVELITAIGISRRRRYQRSRNGIHHAVTGAALLAVLDGAAVPTHSYVLEAPYVTMDTALSCGAALVVYGVYLTRTAIARMERSAAGEHGPSARMPNQPMWLRTLTVVFTVLLVSAGLFAATDEYADFVGTRHRLLGEGTVAATRGDLHRLG